ncbi:MAG: twin-arginine translocation signal domain-containing protein [Bacteroidales bacterium]
MSEVSRRSSLKRLGVMGAAIALGGAASAQSTSDSKPGQAHDKAVPDVSDVAVERFSKGHA